jgi:hypothetical protein
MRQAICAHHVRNVLTSSLVAALLAAGCYRAPKLTGNNQVYDPNIEATLLKDSDLAALTWPEVDNFMRGSCRIVTRPAVPSASPAEAS